MRPYELALALACLAQLALLILLPERRWLIYVSAGMLLAAFLLHAHSQDMRIDMLGVYVTGLAVLIATVYPLSLDNGAKAIVAISGFALIGGTVAVSVLHTPRPRGEYLAGTATLDWRSIVLDAPVDRRPAVKIWFPVEAGREVPPPQAAPFAAFQEFLRTGVTGTPPAPIANAALASKPGTFPVILSFPGGAGANLDTIYLVEELVSWGFVVATIYYPVDLPGIEPTEQAQRNRELSKPFEDYSSDAAFAESQLLLTERVRSRAKDASSVLNALSKLNEQDPAGRFTGRLDIDHAGIFGFSLGGAIAAEARLLDPRFRAAVNIDGLHFGDSAERGVTAPYLLVSSDEPGPPTETELTSPLPEVRLPALQIKKDLEQPVAAMKHNGGDWLLINGTTHGNLMDDAFRCILLRRMPLGPIDPNRAFSILSAYIVEFFQVYLQNRPLQLLDPAARTYRDAVFQSWKMQ